jgi:hypothetical protein
MTSTVASPGKPASVTALLSGYPLIISDSEAAPAASSGGAAIAERGSATVEPVEGLQSASIHSAWPRRRS